MSDSCENSCKADETNPEPHGIIIVDKPPGPTTYDCIRFLRHTCNIPKKWKMGHLGTLDPFASGIVVIALGQAVRYAEYALHSTKKYRARLWLGDETDTLDPTGEVIKSEPVPSDWNDRLQEVASRFTGEIEQVPPAYSAKHIDGKRSYELARDGKTPDLKPVNVEIYSIEFGESTEQWIDFTCHVSGGTYIRSLGRDIAYALGTVGHLLGLERIQSGPFSIDEAIPFSAFEYGGTHVLKHHVRPVIKILEHLPSLTVFPDSIEKIHHGKKLDACDFNGDFMLVKAEQGAYRIMDPDGRFISLGRLKESSQMINPFKPWIV